jgi:hypothetical protein
MGAIDKQPELYTRCQASKQNPFAALGRLSISYSEDSDVATPLGRRRSEARGSYFPAGPRQSGGDAAEIGDLLEPVGGIATGAGFEVTLVAPPALIARTT